MIDEGWDRVGQYALQAKIGDAWQPLATGTTLGRFRELWFEPATAPVYRLSFTEAADAPTLWEFQLFSPKEQ